MVQVGPSMPALKCSGKEKKNFQIFFGILANWDELGPTSLKCFLDHFKSFETKKFSSKNFQIFYGILAKCQTTLAQANWDKLEPTSLKCFLDHFKSFEKRKIF